MANMRTDMKRLAGKIDDDAESVTNAEKHYLKRFRTMTVSVANGAARIPAFIAEDKLRLITAQLVSDVGQTGGAAELNFRVKTHDGVTPAAQTNLSDLMTGAITADTKRSFANIVTSVVIPAGNVVEVEVTVVGAGAAPLQTLFQFETEFVD